MHLYFFISLFFASFILNYFITTSLFLHKLDNFSNNLNRVYLALYKSTWVLVVSCLLFLLFRHDFNYIFLISVFSCVVLIFFLTRYQVGINDKQYLRSLIQFYADTILPSKKIIVKSNNPKIQKLADEVMTKNKQFISDAKELLKQI